MSSAQDHSMIPNMEPRDILQPVATLIGLLATALGVMTGAALEANLFRILINIIVIIIVVFIVVALFTTAAMFSRKIILWSLALVTYCVSWLVFGFGIVAILLAFAYGASIFSITIPKIELTTDLLSLSTFFFAIVATIAGLFVEKGFEQLAKRIGALKVQMDSITTAQAQAKVQEEVSARGINILSAFLGEFANIEKDMRKLAASKGVLIPERSSAFQISRRLEQAGVLDRMTVTMLTAINDVRNRVAHGYDVPERTVADALLFAVAFRSYLQTARASRRR